jgi:hypothetical protein
MYVRKKATGITLLNSESFNRELLGFTLGFKENISMLAPQD